MPGWASEIWKTTEWSKGWNCSEGGEMSRPDLVFVINGIDYPLPSHHWNERTKTSNN